jgi:hypothetical protein
VTAYEAPIHEPRRAGALAGRLKELEIVNILALDPGPKETGWVYWSAGRVAYSGVQRNEDVLAMVAGWKDAEAILATEVFQAMGMAVGAEVFDTCIWIGRFVQAWHSPAAVMRIKRTEVKLHLCGTARAKDPNVRQALLDKIGQQGTRKAPGPTFGVKSHAWSALAVAVTAEASLGGGLQGTMFDARPRATLDQLAQAECF